jgi:hypothetical protein
MDLDLTAIADRLEAIAEELADVAIVRLRESIGAGATQVPLDEKRITQARRAIDKAVHILRVQADVGAADD